MQVEVLILLEDVIVDDVQRDFLNRGIAFYSTVPAHMMPVTGIERECALDRYVVTARFRRPILRVVVDHDGHA